MTLKGMKIKDPLEVRSPLIVIIGLLNWKIVNMFSGVSLQNTKRDKTTGMRGACASGARDAGFI